MEEEKFTKNDFILELAKKMDLSEKDADILYQELITQIQEAMAQEKKIRIANLGSFFSRRDPKSKNHQPKLKLSKKISEALNR